MTNDFRLIHAVVDQDGKLLKLESEASNVLFAVTQMQSGAEVNIAVEGATETQYLNKLVGVPSATQVNMKWLKEKINALVN